MKTFSVPAKYLPMLQSAIVLALHDVRREEKREERGDPRTIQPPRVDDSLTGQCVIQIGVVDLDAQAEDLDWPTEHVA